MANNTIKEEVLALAKFKERAKNMIINKKIKELLNQYQGMNEVSFNYGFNSTVISLEWVEWLKKLGLTVSDAKVITDSYARGLGEAPLLKLELLNSNAELAALDLKSKNYYKSAKDILLEALRKPAARQDRVRLCVFRHILIANKSSRPVNEWDDEFDNKIRDKITEINLLLGHQVEVKGKKVEYPETIVWKEAARAIGIEWMEKEREEGRDPGVIAIAKYVEGELGNRYITGPHGKLLDFETIKKEALTGITGKPAKGKPANKKVINRSR